MWPQPNRDDQQTFRPEDTIGPEGQPTWRVSVSLERMGTAALGQHHVEVLHVRAETYDGAILLAKELYPERMIDVEASRIDNERMA